MPSIDDHIQNVLFNAIKILFPLDVNPHQFIKPHVWRDKKYLGEVNNRVVTWKGWSANLNALDFRYRAIFADVVDNVLPLDQRLTLFGEDFTNATSDLPKFVVIFVLDFPLSAVSTIRQEGFTPRLMSKVAHACCVCGIEEFLSMPATHWAAQMTRLVMLQRILSIHRKPLDANEVPLQNLLYRTGYLHGLLTKGGLYIRELQKPRKAGDFGHDLHAVVQNPSYNPQGVFSLGIELYMGAMGYHAQTIPQYIRYFNLNSVMVVSKDNPFVELKRASNDFRLPLLEVKSISQLGQPDFVTVIHLSLQKVIADLDQFRNEIDEFIPKLPTYLD